MADTSPTESVRVVAEGLALKRGERTLASGLSFAVEAGEALVLRGANGSGKTTLLRTLAGLTPAGAGRCRLEGAGDPARLGWLGHAPGLVGAETPRAHLTHHARMQGESDPRAACQRALSSLGLTALADRPARALSAGQRQRTALARLIAAPAKVWLLDEPSAPLDPIGVGVLDALVAEHRAGGGLVLAAMHRAPDWPGARTLVIGANTAAAA